MKYIVSFARFWYDFIVGDSITLAIGGAGSLAIGVLLVHFNDGRLAEFAVPVVVLATPGISKAMPRR